MSDLARLVLVDTSVWIAYLRKKESAFLELNKLIDKDAICLLGLILAELYQGCKTKKEITVIDDIKAVFPALKDKTGMWEKAGILAYNQRRMGITPNLTDCYIAVAAKEYNTHLFSFDKHFDVLAPACGVQMYKSVMN